MGRMRLCCLMHMTKMVALLLEPTSVVVILKSAAAKAQISSRGMQLCSHTQTHADALHG